ncbi:MAG: hypothetical protein GY807_20970 [Gammaproteobacteria bacterium]|nr:hypothetical protein [Gammaproteobacteria bacterium]
MTKEGEKLISAAKEAVRIMQDTDIVFITQQMATAQHVVNRLRSKEPLTAEEITTGVRLTHEEYIKLFDLAVYGVSQTDEH